MTQKQKHYKASLIKQIHTSKLYVEVYKNDRDLYELMLMSNYNVSSSKDLSIEQLLKLLAFLNQKTTSIEKIYATKNQINFIKTLWDQKAQNPDEKSLLKLIYNRFKIDLKNIEDLEKKDFKKVIALVQNLQIRQKTWEERIAYSKSKLRLAR